MADRNVALCAPRIFDGTSWHENSAVLVADGRMEKILPRRAVPAGIPIEDLQDGFLAPGFVDLQVNGGGGLMLNDAPSAETIAAICRAHARFGTTALLATLITDTREITAAALQAGADAARQNVPGFLGLHLEGPHIALAKKGAHDPALIRPMERKDLDALVAARRKMPVLLATVAPENASDEQISALHAGRVVVSLGHSDADFETAAAAAEAGATLVTHLFNAMSQIGSRAPGLAGAAVGLGNLSAGLIADGVHVAPETIAIALRAKRGPGKIFLVTDAMPPLGTDIASFTLNGRTIHRRDRRLTLDDGTLAGADLDMASAVRFCRDRLGLPLDEALKMASLYPAQAAGTRGHGSLTAGARADMVHLGAGIEVFGTWIGGEKVFPA